MNCSVCITVLNEENTISALLDSLTSQTIKPCEIIIVDGGSVDRTLKIIKDFQNKHSLIKLFKKKCSRAKGRNLSIEITKNDIIVMTD
ncbi:glycosyltransferase, partial [Patescibacteria group bacterium]